MDANKFATMLHRSTIKIKHALVFAGLEWTLIILLLLNAFFQYLMVKFAYYFGLEPPCLWCSRIDHLMEPRKCSNLLRDHVCKAHGEEVSRLGYCLAHQKLADYQSMCEDCSSSGPDFCGVSMKFNFVQWVKATNDEDMVIENGAEGLVCSCCGVILEKQIYSPYVPVKPLNWDHFTNDMQKEILITEEGETDDCGMEDDNSDHTGIDFIIEQFNGDHGFKSKTEMQMLSSVDGVIEGDAELNEEIFGVMITDPSSNEIVHQHSGERDATLEILQQHLEFFIDFTGQQLVPVESTGSTTEGNDIKYRVEKNHPQARLVYEYDIAAQVVSDPEHTEETKSKILEFMEAQEAENYLFVTPKDCDSVHEKIIHINVQDTAPYFLAVSEEVPKMQICITEKEASTRTEIALADNEEREQDVPIASEDVSPFIMSDTDTEVSIGTEIPDLNSTEDTYTEDNHCLHEESSASCTNFHAHYEHGSETDSQETVDLSTFMIELNDHKVNCQSSVYFDINGNEEEKLCERPSSSDGHYHVHNTMIFHERKDSGAEESLEGSVISEFDDEVMTVESLNSTLRAERKALNVLYAELEEERNASAIAANQTMAMINRLQEEKAAMQMEALHYQRMMEEKSEYDQEAMQIMNDLMVKMDKERQWLEKELDICREKLLDYEAKENMGMLGRSMDESANIGFSSVSWSNEEDSDEISIDFHKEENKLYDHQGNGNLSTPVNDVLHFRDRFGNINEERMSIIDKLKVLDNKHFTLSEDEQHFEDVRPFNQEGGKHLERSSGIGSEYEYEEFSIHYN